MDPRCPGQQFVVRCRSFESRRREFNDPAILRQLQPQQRILSHSATNHLRQLERAQRQRVAGSRRRRCWTYHASRFSARERERAGLQKCETSRRFSVPKLAAEISDCVFISEKAEGLATDRGRESTHYEEHKDEDRFF